MSIEQQTEALVVKFWGVRGSYAVPGSQTVAYGGNTACVEVRLGELTLILDAGTGIIGLGKDLVRRSGQSGKAIQAALFFSHLHHDHTQGFPFFTPAFIPSTQLQLFGPGIFERSLEEMLSATMSPPGFPVRLGEMGSARSFAGLHDNQTVWFNHHTASVKVMRSYAHPGGVLVFRIDWRGKSVVYASDIEGYINVDRRLAGFAQGADLLIHDAQYLDEHYQGLLPGLPATQGWGHSTASMACELARQAGVKQLALFHHDPNYDDETITSIARRAAGLFPSSLAASEGLEIRFEVQSDYAKQARPSISGGVNTFSQPGNLPSGLAG